MNAAHEWISGWGNHPKTKATVFRPSSVQELSAIVKEHPGLLARGNGRSYGDSSLNDVVIDMMGMNKVIQLKDDTIEVEAGITLEAIFKHIVPGKRFLAVVPGIRSITIGGAIACDVHGKNHVHEGTFFNITRSIDVMDANGDVTRCSREQNSPLFHQVFGGMGLNGIIVSAVIQLMPIETTWLREQQFTATTLEATFELMEQHRHHDFLVCWMDLLNPTFKAVVKAADWLPLAALPAGMEPIVADKGHPIAVPFTLPIAPPALAFKWNNHQYFSKAKSHPESVLHYVDHFFPLDRLRNWNRIFGPKGMTQYHFRLPHDRSVAGIGEAIALIRSSKVTCTLAVLKYFGKGNAATPYSFPDEGYNFAIDLKLNAAARDLIPKLDAIVSRHEGEVYRTKDAFSTLPKALPTSGFNSLQNQRYAGQ